MHLLRRSYAGPARTNGGTAVACAAVAVAALCLLPIGYLFVAGISVSDVSRMFGYPTTLPTILTTVALTLAVCAVCALLGVGCAYLVVRTDVPGRRLLTVLFAMPLAVPGFVSAYAVYSANLVYLPRTEVVTTFQGAVLVLSLSLYPYVFLTCVVALRGLDPAQEEVGRSLRGGALPAFLRVTLPQLRPAVAAGVLIVSLHVLAEYGAMVQLRQNTLTTRILTEMTDYGNYRSARSLSLLLALLAVAVLLVNRWLSGRSFPVTEGPGAMRPPRPARLGAVRLPVLLAAVVVPLAAVGPTVLMTARGLSRYSARAAPAWDDLLGATGNTLAFAGRAALVATLLALPVSWWISRRPGLPAQLTERSVWLAHSVPNAVLALALVYLATRLVPSWYKTPALLVAAYVILFLPLAVANQRVGLQTALRSFDEVAASLGSRAVRRLTRISLPLALPGVLTGALLVGLDASKELTTTLMLLPFNTQTLATGLWATTNGESLDFTAAAPNAAALVALGSVPVYLIVRHTLRFVR
ncbi:MAG: ABC transporter permease [Actinomycetes bacterium]